MPESNEEIKASLQAVLDDVERNQRIYGSFAGNVTNITMAVIGLTQHVDKLEEHAVQTNGRLDGIDGRLDGIDGRLGRLDKRLGIVEDDVRVTRAHVEKLVGYIIRDEMK